ITPSAAVAPLRRLSRSSSEPRCTSAPAAPSDLALASERARPRTWCPASINSRTTAEPMNPVAPVTKTRMLNFLLRFLFGYDDEIDSQAVSGPRLGRAGDGHQCSSGANHARRPLRDVAAEDIENPIDLADVFEGVVIEVDELLCAEVESRLTGGSAPGADDVRAGLTCELARHRTDYAGRTVHEDA